MPQVYATVYDATSVLVFTKNENGRFFQGQLIDPPRELNGHGRPCFPGGGLNGRERPLQGAIREFREETGITLTGTPVPFTNAAGASCHFFPLPAGTTLDQMRADIEAQLDLANSERWNTAACRVRDNEQASVEIITWANLPGETFRNDRATGWFRGFVGDMKRHLGI